MARPAGRPRAVPADTAAAGVRDERRRGWNRRQPGDDPCPGRFQLPGVGDLAGVACQEQQDDVPVPAGAGGQMRKVRRDADAGRDEQHRGRRIAGAGRSRRPRWWPSPGRRASAPGAPSWRRTAARPSARRTSRRRAGGAGQAEHPAPALAVRTWRAAGPAPCTVRERSGRGGTARKRIRWCSASAAGSR